jgi:hypothetical protein
VEFADDTSRNRSREKNSDGTAQDQQTGQFGFHGVEKPCAEIRICHSRPQTRSVSRRLVYRRQTSSRSPDVKGGPDGVDHHLTLQVLEDIHIEGLSTIIAGAARDRRRHDQPMHAGLRGSSAASSTAAGLHAINQTRRGTKTWIEAP